MLRISSMHLTKDEEATLAGEHGPGRQRAMELLVALGKVYRAEKLTPIRSAHLSGVSYKTIGEGGLEFLEEMSQDCTVSVQTTLNPMGMDAKRWREMGVSEKFASRQLKIIESYRKMGVKANCTCTPYLVGNAPAKGDTIAWAESSALSFANSILGARTNREGGPGALAAAILGKTPEYGLHLNENRRATAIPYFRGIRPDTNQAKIMAAAMASAGSVALFHIEGRTPESNVQDLKGVEKVHIDAKDLLRAKESLSSGKEPDLIALGCPHLSETELKTIAKMLDGKKKNKDIEVWFCTSEAVAIKCPKEKAVLERFGKVVCDTCMVVAPIEANHRVTASNSCKACNYLPGLCDQKCLCESTETLMEMIL
jgi:predicted aconitase